MSDVIRVDLTPEEARLVADAIDWACGSSLNPTAADALAKIRKAQANPLNGPTFDFAKHSDVEIPEEIDPKEIPY